MNKSFRDRHNRTVAFNANTVMRYAPNHSEPGDWVNMEFKGGEVLCLNTTISTLNTFFEGIGPRFAEIAPMIRDNPMAPKMINTAEVTAIQVLPDLGQGGGKMYRRIMMTDGKSVGTSMEFDDIVDLIENTSL